MIQHQHLNKLKLFAAQFFKNILKPLSSGITEPKKGQCVEATKGHYEFRQVFGITKPFQGDVSKNYFMA